MEPDFSKEQAKEMYKILVEIHSALEDKKNNKGGLNKIFQYEIGWLVGIGELLKRINYPISRPAK
ncbi:MAG: hypothetical protein COB85_07730 [Bacteroidetes bacterium]|nr:MAG: hypothetical protein COB85_07730 [Bacteroidota bacterium]